MVSTQELYREYIEDRKAGLTHEEALSHLHVVSRTRLLDFLEDMKETEGAAYTTPSD